MAAGEPLLDHVDVWIFDLDNTLYHARHSLFDQVDVRIGRFIEGLLGVDADAARRVQKEYFRAHGTTLRGLMDRHGIDPIAFLDFVHDIDYGAIPPSATLAAALDGLPGRKLIFTNGTVEHAQRVTERLGVGHHFDGVFDIVDSGYVPKPRPEPYRAMCERHGVAPRRAAMFEDIARNLAPAHAMGMSTVWIRTDSAWGREGSDGAHVHHATDDLAVWLDALVARRRAVAVRSR
ncbi:MAG: pyrimidine 5'-nucleotidase [Alphaproteobacteria bacterium]